MCDNKKIGSTYRYFFILGNTPILSSAEISAVLERRGLSAKWISASEEVAVVETTATIDPSALMATLGGSIKIGRILPSDTTTEQWVRSRKTDRRIVVGVSIYKVVDGVANAKCDEELRTIRGEILVCKRLLKEEGKALRLVTGRERALPSVALVTEHILERGGELVALLSNNGETQLGETLAVQAFHQYRERDMGRPSRDALRGMLPQKVAQMMINLAEVKDGGVICDPFCGSGTVLSEAALLGYNVIGSDISEAAVADTRENFQFLISLPVRQAGNFQQNSKFQILNSKFFVSDVRELSTHLVPASVDAIVTEPYLGPPLTGKESSVFLGKTRRDIHTLVTDAFEAFVKVLRPCPVRSRPARGNATGTSGRPASNGASGRVVMVFPVLGGELLPIDGIEKLGWCLVSLLPPVIARIRQLAETKQSLTDRGTILYSRTDQHLEREITVWERA